MPNNAEQTTLTIDRLALRARVGIHAHERERAQPLRLFVRAQIRQPARAGAQVCYEDIAQRLIARAQARHTPLLESLVQDLANEIWTDKRIHSLWLRVEKPQALARVAPTASTPPLVGMELTRTRDRQG